MTIEIINPLALLIPKKKTQKPKSPPKKKPQNKSAKQLDLTEHKHLETFFFKIA